MRKYSTHTSSEPRTRLCAALALGLALWVGPGSAEAVPVFFDGPDGFGVSATTAQEAFDAGVIELLAEGIPTAMGKVEDVSQIVRNSEVLLFDPPSHETPNFVPSDWTFQNPENSGASVVNDAWLVYFGPQTYTPTDVGFELPTDASWAIVRMPFEDVDYFYPAVRLGTLEDGDQVTFRVEHLAAVELLRDGNGDFVLARYGIGVLSTSAPEPGSLPLVTMFSLVLLLGLRLGGGTRGLDS